MTDIRVERDDDRDRYAAYLADSCVGVLSYDDEPGDAGGVRDMRSTVVSPDHAGEGVGSALVRHALEDTRASGLRVRATCWFVRGWIDRHEEYRSLLAPGAGEGNAS